MNKIVLTFVVCLGLVSHGSAAVVQGVGACPNGVEPGQSWYPEGCQKCDCEEGGYTCYSCGSVNFPPECKAIYDTTKQFPGCCAQLDCSDI